MSKARPSRQTDEPVADVVAEVAGLGEVHEGGGQARFGTLALDAVEAHQPLHLPGPHESGPYGLGHGLIQAFSRLGQGARPVTPAWRHHANEDVVWRPHMDLPAFLS